MIQPKSISNWRKVHVLSACFVFALATLSSCKKEVSNIGTSILSPEDLLNSGGVDTFKLNTYSVKEDSIPTDNQTFGVLGAYHDPKMGITNASFYTQFNYVGTVSFPVGAVVNVDSVVLSLRYGGYYGKLDPQTFQVHRVDEDMDVEETYYKSTVKSVLPTDLVLPTNATQTPDPTTKVVVNGDTLPAQLRLKLATSLGDDLINEAINGTAFQSQTNFVSFFKGLRVSVANATPTVGTGGVFYMNLNDNDSKLTVFYKIQGDTNDYSIDFSIESTCADFNHVEIDNSGYDIAQVLANPINGLKQFYAQAFNSRAVIEFDEVNTLSSSAIIHGALLVVPIAHQTLNEYYPSVNLTIGYKTDDGSIIGFKVVAYDDATKSYIVDVRDYVQNIVKGTTVNRGVYLYPTFFSSTAERIVFNGTSSSYKEKPRLIIKYTEF